MLITCWSVKGGAGVSVVSAALVALLAQRHGNAAVIDLGGDQPAVLGLAEPQQPGVLDWCDSDAGPDRLASLAVEVTDDLRLVPRGEGGTEVTLERATALASAAATLAPAVVVDAGVALGGASNREAASGCTRPHAEHLRDLGTSLFVTRACYVALRRAKTHKVAADGVIVVDEPGRALDAKDVSQILEMPVLGVVEADPRIARAVDSGTLVRRMPGTLARGLRRAG